MQGNPNNYRTHGHERIGRDAMEDYYNNEKKLLEIHLLSLEKIIYTGTNYDEVKRLCGDKVLAPYFCMGFSMLSVDTGEGFVSVNEGDTIVREDDGSLRIEK